MKSDATTVQAYLASLPADRRAILETVRERMMRNLDRQRSIGSGGGSVYEERMLYGGIAFCVPHRIWPQGHRVHPELPLMYAGMSSQKNDVVLYLMFLHLNQPMREWFDQAWRATGKRLDISTVGGCCLRFRKLEDLNLDVLDEAMRRVTVEKFLANHRAWLEEIEQGKSAKKKASKKVAPKVTPKVAKRVTKKVLRKVAKKKAVAKRGRR